MPHLSPPCIPHLISPETYIGDVYALDFSFAWIQIYATYCQGVGGVPHGCLVLATRLAPTAQGAVGDYVLVLRVLDPVRLPGHDDAGRIRAELARNVAGSLTQHWDHPESMDTMTHHLFSFSGLRCRIIGNLVVHRDDLGIPQLHFGRELVSLDENTGLKVYKPNGATLAAVVNYRDTPSATTQHYSTIGHVRYSATPITSITAPVMLDPYDIVGQKTAIFGMTRTGKSTTAKKILQAVYRLRFVDPALRIGQLVFDANGEYANDNLQDGTCSPTSIRQIWRMDATGDADDIVTYGIHQQHHDPHRQMLLVNFFDDATLAVGKRLIDDALTQESAKFIQHFRYVRFDSTSHSTTSKYSQNIRYDRHKLVYRALLVKAGFSPPARIKPRLQGLFGANLIKALLKSESPHVEHYLETAQILQQPAPTWDQVVYAVGGLALFVADRHSGYATFEANYIQHSSTNEAWADDPLHALLGMARYPNGVRYLARVRHLHTPNAAHDYAQSIYEDLVAGKLVLIDQSIGDAATMQLTSERVLQMILAGQQAHFRAGNPTPPIILYIEEAHTLLPAGNDHDTSDIWVRTAKEGAKYHIGMVYATQEVTSIQRNILKNTSNWFIGHLNNTDEVRELAKYEDFADFEDAIRRANVRGFVRMKTRSQPFTIPVQITPLVLEGDEHAV